MPDLGVHHIAEFWRCLRFGPCSRPTDDVALSRAPRRLWLHFARATSGGCNMVRSIGVLGVPTSAGTHYPGQEKAPKAWRSAGLLDVLRDRELDVVDYGDLPLVRYRPVEPVQGVRDLDRVAAVARETASKVKAIRLDGRVPLVLGGDCTITLGVLAGLEDVGLIYFDGDADLSTPERSVSNVADTMGMTHMLGGGVASLAHLGDRAPLLTPDRVVVFGFDPAELNTDQWAQVSGRRLYAMPSPSVQSDPVGTAAAARSYLEERAGTYLLHFDVDVVDTGSFPLANFPHFAGLGLGEAGVCLRQFATASALAGLVVTEVNPDHDPDGSLLEMLTVIVAEALVPADAATEERENRTA